jgi:Tol biopolymer transport system component
MDGGPAQIFDVSADGRVTVGPERTPAGLTDIVLRDILTGRSSVIVPGTQQGGGFQARVSDNGDRVAYAWSDNGTMSIRVVATAPGSSPVTIQRSAASTETVSPLDWFPDGRDLLAISFTPEQPFTLFAVSATGGGIRTIKALEPWRMVWPTIQLSPDGSTIAYSALAAEGSSDRYIFTVSTRGGPESVAVRMAGVNQSPAWSPDGSSLLFINGRNGQTDLRAVPMRGGEPTGEPFLVQRNFAGSGLFVTRAGELFYPTSNDGGFSEFVAERDGTTTRIVQTFQGQSGAWSRGNRLAFIRPAGGTVDLIVRTMATGAERTFSHEGGFLAQSSRWLHDDSALIVARSAQMEPGSAGGAFYRLDARTGEMKWLFARNTADHVRAQGVLVARDDRSIYTVTRKDPQSPWTSVVSIDLETGAETLMFNLPAPGISIAGSLCWDLSPDGTKLAISVPVVGSTTRSRLITVNIDGSDWREIYSYDNAHWVDVLHWTPDGQSLLFVASPVGAPAWRLMRIPSAGGPAVPDGLDSSAFVSTVPLPKIELRNIANFDVSPDGSRVVFGSRTIAMHELWSLDNVMSALAMR